MCFSQHLASCKRVTLKSEVKMSQTDRFFIITRGPKLPLLLIPALPPCRPAPHPLVSWDPPCITKKCVGPPKNHEKVFAYSRTSPFPHSVGTPVNHEKVCVTFLLIPALPPSPHSVGTPCESRKVSVTFLLIFATSLRCLKKNMYFVF